MTEPRPIPLGDMLPQLVKFLASLFSCQHQTLSRVFTNPTSHFSYVTCLSCGASWHYSWRTMKLGGRLEAKEPYVTWETAQGPVYEPES